MEQHYKFFVVGVKKDNRRNHYAYTSEGIGSMATSNLKISLAYVSQGEQVFKGQLVSQRTHCRSSSFYCMLEFSETAVSEVEYHEFGRIENEQNMHACFYIYTSSLC